MTFSRIIPLPHIAYECIDLHALKDPLYLNKELSARSRDLIASITDPSLVSSSDIDSTPMEKVKACTMLLQRVLNSQQGKFLPVLSKVSTVLPMGKEGKPVMKNLIQVLAHIACFSTKAEKRERAFVALQQLEQSDPFIETITRAILQRDQQKVRRFISKPPESSLKITFPIRPFSDSALLPQQISYRVQNREFHDAFWKIDTLVIGRAARCFQDNLNDIQQIEQFRVVKFGMIDTAFSWLRDSMLITGDHRIIVPQRLNIDKSFSRMLRKFNRDSPTDALGVVGSSRSTEMLLKAGIPNLYEAPFYFEGGNVIHSVVNGEEVYVWGPVNLTCSILNSPVTFRGQEKRLLETLETRSQKAGFPEEKNLQYILMRLEDAGLLENFTENEKRFICLLTLVSIDLLKKDIEVYLGKKVIHLGYPLNPQPAFHLDIFARAAPGGVMLLNDFQLCMRTIDQIFETVALSYEERSRLQTYYSMAEEHQEHFGQELESYKKKLEKYGFKVIPVPGLYYMNNDKISLRLLNAVIGLGPDGPYCISNGGKYALDRLLQLAFANVLRNQGINNIYFTGRPSNGEICSTGEIVYADSHSDGWYGGGIHCRVQEVSSLHPDFPALEKLPAWPPKLPPLNPNTNGREALRLFWREMLELSAISARNPLQDHFPIM